MENRITKAGLMLVLAVTGTQIMHAGDMLDDMATYYAREYEPRMRPFNERLRESRQLLKKLEKYGKAPKKYTVESEYPVSYGSHLGYYNPLRWHIKTINEPDTLTPEEREKARQELMDYPGAHQYYNLNIPFFKHKILARTTRRPSSLNSDLFKQMVEEDYNNPKPGRRLKDYKAELRARINENSLFPSPRNWYANMYSRVFGARE